MQFLQHAPGRDGVSSVPIKIALMSIGDAARWQRQIQPYAQEAGAPDRNWNWPYMRRWLPLTEMALGRRAPALTVWTRGANDAPVPVAMILLAEGHSALNDHAKQSVFLWFMAAAPEAALREYGVRVLPKLGRVLIDIAVTHSHNCGYAGRIGATPAASLGLGCSRSDAAGRPEPFHARCA